MIGSLDRVKERGEREVKSGICVGVVGGRGREKKREGGKEGWRERRERERERERGGGGGGGGGGREKSR